MSDLISKEDVIKTIMQTTLNLENDLNSIERSRILTYVNFFKEKIINKISSLPSNEPKHLVIQTNKIKEIPSVKSTVEWIPINENLPKEGTAAILKYSNDKISGGIYIGNKAWIVDYGDNDSTVTVKAWMELPQVYNGDKNHDY